MRIEIAPGSQADQWLKEYKKDIRLAYLDADGFEATMFLYCLKPDVIATRIWQGGTYKKEHILKSGNRLLLEIVRADASLLHIVRITLISA